MKFLVALAVLFVAVNAVTIEEKWTSFKATHLKEYHPKEEQKRLATFQENLKRIEEHNAKYESGEVSYYYTITKFADLTGEEFMSLMNSQLSKKPNLTSTSRFVIDSLTDVPVDIDWRLKGAVLPIKNQGSCGSCWAFSTTGALEGQLAIKTGQQQALSEQQLVDCSTQNSGCGGGWMDWAFNYVKESGICSEESYPYTAVEEICKQSQCQSVISTLQGFIDIDTDENALKAAVGTVGPVSVAVAATIEWQLYGGGLLDLPDCNSIDVNHGVLVVGYGQDGSDYWIIKNSWGLEWGEEGYIRLFRGSNQCHVSEIASYPQL
jgi:cathepsin L